MRKGKAATGKSRLSGRCLQRAQTDEVAEKTSEEEPQLAKMDTEKRHRLRLLNKKLCYSIESFEELFPDKRFSRQQTALKVPAQGAKIPRAVERRCERPCSGGRSGARRASEVPVQFLSHKREKRLIREAAAAYRKLAALE